MLFAQGKQLPSYVSREFDDYLKCGRLEHGFLRVRCDNCHHEKLWPSAVNTLPASQPIHPALIGYYQLLGLFS